MATFGRTQTIEQQVGAGGRVSIRVTSSDTRVRAIDGDTARVRATFEIGAPSETDADRIYAEVQMRVNAGDGFLEVEEPRTLTRSVGHTLGRLLGRGHVDLELDVEVPHGCELQFEGVSADVQAEGLLGSQRYRTVSGDVLLREAGGSIRIDDTSGDLTIRATDALALHANAVSGDLSVVAPHLTAVRVNSVSGDVELEGAFEGAAEHRIDTVSGDASIGLIGGATFEVRGLSTDISSRLPHRLEGRSDQRRVIVGDGSARIRFGSMSGDLSISAPRRLSAAEPSEGDAPAASDEMEILRAVERGEIDVEEAARRLGGNRSE
ncbi:MAG TPA: DUF4097 family beta strand repeat-containing protein [Candidatus Limnocylindria bacterium]|nr:DUF4097 family beta strand repeat-containing protein [Candidatus Limnocylindria bacterium]